MISRDEAHEALQSFFEEDLLSEILHEVKSGKEASVFCCRSKADDLPELIAAKVYRPSEQRSFQRKDIYLAGRVERAHNTRIHRALKSGSAFGKKVDAYLWIQHEWELLTRLYSAGVPTPRPIAVADRAILMSYAGDEQEPAPMLSSVRFERSEVETIADEVLAMIEAMLDCHCVHGDLSPYNILFWQGRPMLIDVPQAVDPRLNPGAQTLLRRDVRNICDWAAKVGVSRDTNAIADDLWTRFTLGEIG